MPLGIAFAVWKTWEDIAMKVSALVSMGIVVAILSVAPTNAQITQKTQKLQTKPEWNPGEPWPPKWATFDVCVAAGKKFAWDLNTISLWCGAQAYGAVSDKRVSGTIR
jgi:hypothetical protein